MRSTRSRICPNDFILEILFPKHFIHYKPQIPADAPIAMNIDTAIVGEKLTHQTETFVNHGDETVRALAPRITIGNLFENVRFLGESFFFFAEGDFGREISAHIERRIDVDEFQSTGGFNLPAHRTVHERGENELVVAPDEFVRPTRDLPSACIEEFQGRVFLGARLVHVFDRLERKNDVRHFACFAVPDEFDFALVVKERKTKAIGQRLSLLDE